MKKKLITIIMLCFIAGFSISFTNKTLKKNQKNINDLMLTNIEALACEALESDLTTGGGIWCNCSDLSTFCGTHPISGRSVMGVREVRTY